jgi:hypothetical protein
MACQDAVVQYGRFAADVRRHGYPIDKEYYH